MKYIIASFLIMSSAQAAEVCKMTPQQTVRFGSEQDLIFPTLPKEKVSGKDFVIEQFIPEKGMARALYVVRGPDGGLHLAADTSMQLTTTQKGLRYLSGSICREGDRETVLGLLQAKEKSDWQILLEEMRRLSRLPDDKVLCKPSEEARVSLDDSAYARLNARIAGPPPLPGQPVIVPPRLTENSFRLLGQVMDRADAPKEYLNVQFAPQGDPSWRKADKGMYLVKDRYGRIHAIKPEELAGASVSRLRTSAFLCFTPEYQEPVIREIHPDSLRERPATTAH